MESNAVLRDLSLLSPLEKWTSMVLLVFVIIAIFFDIYLYLNDEQDDTISNIIRDWVYDKCYFISFAWGVLTGHFFLGAEDPFIKLETLQTLLILAIILIALYIHGRWKKPVMKPYHQLILLTLGVLFGHFFWSMND